MSKSKDLQTVKIELLDNWTRERAPNGVMKLAIRAEVSPSAIFYIRRGVVPTLPIQAKLAQAIGCSITELFPITKGKT
jgi:hypothetical protein